MLSEQAINEIRALQARYPVARSALGPALYVAQREVGWLPPEAIAAVGGLFGLDPAEVAAQRKQRVAQARSWAARRAADANEQSDAGDD